MIKFIRLVFVTLIFVFSFLARVILQLLTIRSGTFDEPKAKEISNESIANKFAKRKYKCNEKYKFLVIVVLPLKLSTKTSIENVNSPRLVFLNFKHYIHFI